MSIICIVAMLATRSDSVFDVLVGIFYQGTLTLSGVRISVEGLEHIPASSSCVFVANHASHFDIPSAMIGLGNKRIRIIYKKELERIPIFGWAMKWTNKYIAINRGRGIEAQQSLEEAIRRIQ
ncbi:MAG: 1-acyl-sn-glycerol-3-phosphate acyltransferase, partial [Bacteroidetes bacterium]